MPDFNFTISIPVTADMTGFKEQVRAGVAEATQGVSVPVSPGGAPGAVPGRGRASATFSPSEQAAVDRAMAHAQGAMTPAGTYRLPGGYVPQPGFDPQGWRNVPQAQERGGSRYDPAERVRDRFRSMSSRTDSLLTQIAALRASADPAEAQERAVERIERRQERQVDRHEERARRRTGAGGGFFGLPTSSFRGLLGLVGGSEVFGGVNASLIAETQTSGGELGQLQARQQAIGRLTGGLFGSTIAGGLNAVDLGLRAAGNARGLGNYSIIGLNQATEAAEAGVASARVGAGRVTRGREINEEIARANEAAYNISTRGSYLRQSDAIHFRQRQFERGLDLELDSLQAQSAAEQDPNRRNDIIREYNQLARNYTRRIDASRGVTNAEGRQLTREASLRYRALGRRRPALQAQAEGRFGEAEELSFGADLADLQETADEDNPRQSLRQRQLNWLAVEGRGARESSRIRSRDRQTFGNLARLARAPDASVRLIELDDEERVSLEGAKSDTDRDSVRRNFASRRGLVAQQFQDQRYDLNTSLDSAINQSALRTRGGSSNRLAADLDVIVQRSRAEALDLERQGLDDEAAKRRRLGGLQVREFRADYFRNVQYEEFSGSRIATGRGNPFRDVERNFKRAEEAAGSRGPGENAGGMSAQHAEQMIELLRQILNRHFRARAS